MKIFKKLGIRDYSLIGDVFSVFEVMLCLWGMGEGDWLFVIISLTILGLIKYHEGIKQQLIELYMKAEKEFVPHFIAIKLKELGFDEECFSYYVYPDNKLDFILDGHDKVRTRRNSEFTNSCSAPLWQQVFRWFRDKHGYHGIVDSCGNICEWKIASIHLDKSIRSRCIHGYDDAQLVCVEKLIELIEKKSLDL